MPALPRPDEIIAFWREAGPARWFRKDDAFDADFRDRFLAAHEAAAAGALDAWQSGADGCLALLILVDQFPRNAFRGSARTFATDARAREVADHAARHGWNTAVEPALQQFMVLPFMHSESLADQDRCVLLSAPLGDEARRYAEHHRAIIARFGRFPHRNALLGRESTPEELAFLHEGGFAG